MKKQRENKVQSLGGAIRQMLNEFHIEQKFSQSDLLRSWPEVVGPTIASKTTRLFIKNKILFVEINSAPLKNELNQSKSLLLKRMEETLGNLPISDVKII